MRIRMAMLPPGMSTNHEVAMVTAWMRKDFDVLTVSSGISAVSVPMVP